jgi:60 kDa SS-A/Ro ribonucleoprotein
MTIYGEVANTRSTPQTEQAKPEQRPNNAGGFSFVVDKWTRLDRFLVLGAQEGTYYVTERKHIKGNVASLQECIAEDGLRTVARIVEISDAGRAPKNDPAIFALAVCAGAKDPKVRAAALAALPKVCRIGTHLFHFVADVEGQRRWGRSLRRAVSAWYTERSVESLALQVSKYQSRDKWSHKDVLRLAHPTAPTPAHDAVLRWVTRGAEGMAAESKRSKGIAKGALPPFIQAFEAIHSGSLSAAGAAALIREFKLPHECVPNELKGKPEIWEALLEGMGPTAIIRNLNKMTSVGLLAPMSKATQLVVGKLTDTQVLFQGRVHPLTMLFAQKTYASGRGLKGDMTWTPLREVVDALDEGFYASFQAIEPTGKRFYLGLDVSGSMSSFIANTSLSCREGAGAMAMVTARSEKLWHCAGFTAKNGQSSAWGSRGGTGMTVLNISPKQRLTDVTEELQRLPFGRTDCSLPMQDALEKKLEIDVFCVYTDNETYAGSMHPHQALEAYRQKMGIAAKLVVVGMEANEFTIADPSDSGMLDVVGFDAAAPGIIADFAATREVRT